MRSTKAAAAPSLRRRPRKARRWANRLSTSVACRAAAGQHEGQVVGAELVDQLDDHGDGGDRPQHRQGDVDELLPGLGAVDLGGLVGLARQRRPGPRPGSAPRRRSAARCRSPPWCRAPCRAVPSQSRRGRPADSRRWLAMPRLGCSSTAPDQGDADRRHRHRNGQDGEIDRLHAHGAVQHQRHAEADDELADHRGRGIAHGQPQRLPEQRVGQHGGEVLQADQGQGSWGFRSVMDETERTSAWASGKPMTIASSISPGRAKLQPSRQLRSLRRALIASKHRRLGLEVGHPAQQAGRAGAFGYLSRAAAAGRRAAFSAAAVVAWPPAARQESWAPSTSSYWAEQVKIGKALPEATTSPAIL